MINVDITIPVLDEAETLDRQIRILLDHIQDSELSPYSIQIVIADNGSSDSSPEIAKRLAGAFVAVQFIRLQERGVGRALKRSWDGSTADIIGYMDLDLATDLQHLAAALDAITKGHADVVTGSRLANGAEVIGRTPLRSVTSRIFNCMLHLYLRASFSDGMCGFKFLRRDVLAPVRAAGAENDGWFFPTEMLVCAEWLGFDVHDLPVKWTDDPDSKVRIGRLAIEYIKAMIALKSRLRAKTTDSIRSSLGGR